MHAKKGAHHPGFPFAEYSRPPTTSEIVQGTVPGKNHKKIGDFISAS